MIDIPRTKIKTWIYLVLVWAAIYLLRRIMPRLAFAVMSHQQVACQRNICGAWGDGLAGKASPIVYNT